MNQLRLYVTNAFGLSSKLGEFQHDLARLHPDIAVITETKLTQEKISPSDLAFPGYAEPIRKDRTAQGGGVAVWIKSSLAFRHMDYMNCGDNEVIWVSLQTAPGKSIAVCCVYRPGSCSDTDIQLMDYLDRSIDSARQSNSHILITGDFNVHNKDWLGSSRTTKAGEACEDFCYINGLEQHVHEPTRGSNILDLIMSDLPGQVSVTTHPPLGKSDHVCLLAVFQCPVAHEPKVKRTVWRYTQADWPRLNNYFRSIDWTQVLQYDANTSCRALTDTILKGMRQFIPHKQLSTRPSEAPWWTPECTAAVNRKQKTWKARKHQPSSETARAQHAAASSASAATLQQAKAKHMSSLKQKLVKGSLSSKEWWSTVKRVGGQSRCHDIPIMVDPSGNQCITNQEKAECLAEHFSKKCKLDNDFKGEDSFPQVRTRLQRGNLSCVRFRPATIRRELKHLNISKATGSDNIPAHVLRACATSLAYPLSKLFSQCLREGTQPDLWKTATVVAVHKRKSKSDVRNYRPISLLPIISKVMESIVNRSIMNFYETHDLLSQNQFGFRRGLGAADLLTLLQYHISTVAGHGGATRMVAVDIAGAFDRVSHPGVLHKAACYGLNGTLLNWLTSYLSQRKLKVVIAGQQSSLYPVSAGVPQGSILGPTLFLTYINDAEDHLPAGVKMAVYADDTTLYKCISSPASITPDTDLLQESLDALHNWGTQWRVAFEPTKSQSLAIAHHRPPWQLPNLVFGGESVQTTSELKLLGVTFDEQLSFNSHIRNLTVRANQRMHFFRKAAAVLTSTARATVYKGFVRPLLEYCPLVWNCASVSTLARLEGVQRRALHIIGPNVVLQSLAVRRKVAALTYLYKLQSLPHGSSLRDMLPPQCTQSSTPTLSCTTRRQSQPQHDFQLCLTIPVASRNSLLNTFPYGTIRDWNRLPPDLLRSPPNDKGLQSFKSAVNKFLLEENWLWATDHL